MKNAILIALIILICNSFAQTSNAIRDSNETFIWKGILGNLYRQNKETGKARKYYLPVNDNKAVITSVYCEKNGSDYVWIGTTDGLFKFDNYAFHTFDTDNNVLPENGIRTLNINASGKLIVTTSHLVKLTVHKNKLEVLNSEIASSNVNKQRKKTRRLQTIGK